MHEFAIAQSLLDIVREHVPPERAPLARLVRVRVGVLAGVVPDSLAFCFEAIVSGTPFAGARLDVEVVPARALCDECSHAFESAEPVFACPACGRGGVRVLSGGELHLADIELADEPAEEPSNELAGEPSNEPAEAP